MRHRKYTFKIGRTGSHRRAMMANMVCSLLTEGRIKTTLTKGKQVRRFTDRMITLGKAGTLAARRKAAATLNQSQAVQALFNEVAIDMAERPGGYTRLLKLGQRQGDAAEMCLVELVTEPVAAKTKAAAPATTENEEVAAVEATTDAVTTESAEDGEQNGDAEEETAQVEASDENAGEEKEEKKED